MANDLTSRYAAAEQLLPPNLKKKVLAGRLRPGWIERTDRFWYSVARSDRTEFLLIDPAAGRKTLAFDHARMAAALGTLLGQEIDATKLPFSAIEIGAGVVRVAVGRQRIEVDLENFDARFIGIAPAPDETRSPDGRRTAFRRNDNLFVRDLETGAEQQLTFDGTESFGYATVPDCSALRVLQENVGFPLPAPVIWSPDSRRLITHRLDQRDVELMHLIRSSPQDGGRPRLLSYRYALIGDEALPTIEFFVIDVRSGDITQAKCEPVLSPYMSPIMFGHVWFDEAGSSVYWLSGDRGDRTMWLRALNPATGEVRVLVEETSATTVQPGAYFLDNNVKVLRSGEIVWWSDRTGWGHAYRYDTAGNVHPLTSGEWLVRKVVAVDEKTRTLVFTGAGREPGLDPYIQQIYAVSLDGGEVRRLTEDAFDHSVTPSPTGRFLVDVMSTVFEPGSSVVRDLDGKVVVHLESTDASALFAAGYHVPERVTVKAADGVTDLWCTVYQPHDFDPTKQYPVLDEIYPGPQLGAAPVRFPATGGAAVGTACAPSFAALGFAVVVIEARGTPLRSKAFQDHARLVRDGDYLDDHVVALRQLAETRRWLDLDRVGIFGTSGGGYASTRALLTFPDFYKVGVSAAGDHDDRVYHATWGERFYGFPDTFDYATHANGAHVHNLVGKLLLIHGEMDDNVTPHQTMRLVDKLMAANKDFDLLIVPNADHTLTVHQAYWLRRRWDYLVEHLMGETPPAYRIADIPMDFEALNDMLGG